MIDLSLLKILADGKFHSGTALGNELGLSRSAIWKQMQALQDFGVDVYSVRGRGYRLPFGLDLLDKGTLLQHLDASTKEKIEYIQLETFVDSTNLMALRNIRERNHAALYLAEYQSAGKGRRGRSWVGPLASNLYMSLIWRFTGGAAALEGLSLLVGLSLVQSLERAGIAGLELKWPNDLLYQGRKLAGILLEMQGDASGDVSVVIGVGINVLMNAENQQYDQIDQPWVDLTSIADRKINRNQLLGVILNQLLSNLQLFADQGLAPFVDEWHRYHAFQDSYVRLLNGQQAIEGICRGIDQRGALLLERYAKLEAYHGGEISVRQIAPEQ